MASRLSAAFAIGVLCAVAGVGCGDDDDRANVDDLPPGVIATVGDTEIGKQELEQQVAALARARRGSADTKADASVQRRLRSQALSALLMRQALEQEAADRGISVSTTEVAQRWRAVSGDQFKTKKALKRFLGGQTERDLLNQLRLQALSERIGEQVAEEAGGGKEGAQALKRFQAEFRERWADRTACAKGYTATAGCVDPAGN